MNKVRERILENLESRVYPVCLPTVIRGVEVGGLEELQKMVAEGIIEPVDAFGGSRIESAGMYRVSITWTNRNYKFD